MSPSERERSRERRVTSLFGTVLGLWLVLGGIGLGLSGLGPLRWLAAVPLAALGAFVLSKALPRLYQATAQEAETVPLTAPERGERRLRCPCCGSPSLDPDVPDQSCPACEWLVDGLPGDAVAPPEEIAAARENFRRFLSVYPPDARPEWSPDPPSADELELRRDLIERYALALSRPEDRGIWWEIEQLERRIGNLELEYSEEVEARAGRELGALEEEEDEEAEKEEQQPILEGPEPRRESGSE